MFDYKSFFDSNLGSLYHVELFYQIDKIISLCEEIFSECEGIITEGDPGGYIKVDPEIHTNIYTILTSAANVAKLIDSSEKRKRTESKKVYERRIERGLFFTALLKGVEMKEMKMKQTRNTVEHFDENIDKYSVKMREGYKQGEAVLYNMVISSWNVFDLRPYPMRLYVSNERMFYNFEKVSDLGKIYDEAKAIEVRLAPLFKDEDHR